VPYQREGGGGGRTHGCLPQSHEKNKKKREEKRDEKNAWLAERKGLLISKKGGRRKKQQGGGGASDTLGRNAGGMGLHFLSTWGNQTSFMWDCRTIFEAEKDTGGMNPPRITIGFEKGFQLFSGDTTSLGGGKNPLQKKCTENRSRLIWPILGTDKEKQGSRMKIPVGVTQATNTRVPLGGEGIEHVILKPPQDLV